MPISNGDQAAYHDLVNEAIVYLEDLSQRLAQSYEELYPQNVDINNLGSATEALIFAVGQLKDQKIELESYKKRLQSSVTDIYDEELANGKKESR